jgi:6-pyruvoyltetrahydropterin/6-carboxytetrahydropterin synthase
MMYTVCVRDHFMIAHSFRGEIFGPAQRLHGATYVVDLELRRPELDADGVVVDIGKAGDLPARGAGGMELPQPRRDCRSSPAATPPLSSGARAIFDRIAIRIEDGQLGVHATDLTAMRVTLHESHVAWAAYEGPLP